MEQNKIRANSVNVAQRLGVLINVDLPFIDASAQLRSVDEIFKRAMCLHAVAACAYGFDRRNAHEWLIQEDCFAYLSNSERKYIAHGADAVEQFKVQVEGIWALSWALGLVSNLDFSKHCDKDFVFLLPNLKVLQSSSQLKAKVKARSLNQIMEACDLVYCLHWSMREARITGNDMAINFDPIIIVERRKALDWLITTDDWDTISLDT